MKRLLATISLVAVSSAAATAATTAAHPSPAAKPAPSAPHKMKIAPADEYFGRLKISILGIANTIKDQGLRFDSHPEQLAAAMGSVGNAEDAIRDWQKKYPGDPWLPKTLLSLERFYLHVGDNAKANAEKTTAWLAHDFPKSTYSALGKKELADARSAPATPASTAAVEASAAGPATSAATAANAPASAVTPPPNNPAAPK